MTITEVSKKYALSADTLRYYERIGLVPPVHRTSGGIRDYTDEDCNWVGFIKCMRGAGLPIEVLIDYVAFSAQGDSTIDATKDLLTEQRRLLAERIADMQATLERLDKKIKSYEETIVPAEKRLRDGTDS